METIFAPLVWNTAKETVILARERVFSSFLVVVVMEIIFTSGIKKLEAVQL
ncbi:hypothetical protein KHA80_13765 [Anaerobacillus sp. HL2]|nr:hypothetical protein KHA80_13765 [Anaerobacillus sp. HL2]